MKRNKKNNSLDYLDPYKYDRLEKVPSWLTIIFLKYWVAAAAFFFFGNANPVVNYESSIAYELYYIWISLGLGLMMEYILKPIVRLMRNSRNDTYKYNLINLKGIKSFLLNLVYSFFIMLIMFVILVKLAAHNLVFNAINGEASAIEPITAGFVFIFVDGIFVLIKNLIIRIIKMKRYKKDEEFAKELEGKILSEE